MNMTSKAGEAKAKINARDYLKLESFCTAKEVTHTAKGQPTEWEKAVANAPPIRGRFLNYMENSYGLTTNTRTTRPLLRTVSKMTRSRSWLNYCLGARQQRGLREGVAGTPRAAAGRV